MFALLFLLWEVAVHLTGIKEYLLPPPSKVWTEFLKRYDTVMGGAWVTTQEIIAGYLLAIVVSIPLALAVAYSRFVENRDLSGGRVPADHSEDRDRAAVHHLVRLRLHAQAAAGVSAVVLSDRGREHRGLQVGRSRNHGFRAHHRRGRWKMFVKIRLPQALPDIFTGLKVGAALSATAAVVAEFVASDRGLGYLLLQYNGNLETPMVFAIIVLLSLIGLAVYYAVEIIERITIPWHVSQQPADVTIT